MDRVVYFRFWLQKMWLKIIDEEGWSTFSNCTIIAFAKSSASAGGSLDDRQVSSIHRLKGISRINIIVIAGLIFYWGCGSIHSHHLNLSDHHHLHHYHHFLTCVNYRNSFSQDQLHCHDQPNHYVIALGIVGAVEFFSWWTSNLSLNHRHHHRDYNRQGPRLTLGSTGLRSKNITFLGVRSPNPLPEASWLGNLTRLQWLYWEAPILKKIGYKRALLESAKKKQSTKCLSGFF